MLCSRSSESPIGEHRDQPLVGLPHQIELGTGGERADLMSIEVQTYLRLPGHCPPFAAPVTLAPQFELAVFRFHGLRRASVRAESVDLICELLWKSCDYAIG